MPHDPLLRALVDDGWLNASQAEAVAQRAAREAMAVDSVLLVLGLVDEPRLLSLLARAWGGDVADQERLDGVSADACAALPRAVAEQHRLVPVELNGRKLTVACCVPDDPAAFELAIDEVGFTLRLYLRTVWTTERLLARAMHRTYGTPIPPGLRSLAESLDGHAEPPARRSVSMESDWKVAARLDPGLGSSGAPAPSTSGAVTTGASVAPAPSPSTPAEPARSTAMRSSTPPSPSPPAAPTLATALRSSTSTPPSPAPAEPTLSTALRSSTSTPPSRAATPGSIIEAVIDFVDATSEPRDPSP